MTGSRNEAKAMHMDAMIDTCWQIIISKPRQMHCHLILQEASLMQTRLGCACIEIIDKHLEEEHDENN